MNPASIPDFLRPPVLSICVPTYNRARYLECLLTDLGASIGGLGYTYELLIGDNASEDQTADVISRWENQLTIRYFQRPENIGAARNLSELFSEARGRYIVYVADDDLLIPEALGRHIGYLEENPDVGAVFAPWFMHDRVEDVDCDQFYYIPEETCIPAGNHGALFDLLVNNHVFPEIYIARTTLAREVAGDANMFAYFFFVQIAAMVDRTSVAFRAEPYYRSVNRYFEDEAQVRAGHEEVKSGWDRYRGGLEYILAKVAHRLDAENLAWCHRAIDQFVRIRMEVALRLRTLAGEDWVDNYYIANRLRSTGNESLLYAPYATYRINAAWEYLSGLQPFLPNLATVGYYLDDPPQALTEAHGFSTQGMMAKADRSVPFPDNVILLTSREPAIPGSAKFVISEAELLARFP